MTEKESELITKVINNPFDAINALRAIIERDRDTIEAASKLIQISFLKNQDLCEARISDLEDEISRLQHERKQLVLKNEALLQEQAILNKSITKVETMIETKLSEESKPEKKKKHKSHSALKEYQNATLKDQPHVIVSFISSKLNAYMQGHIRGDLSSTLDQETKDVWTDLLSNSEVKKLCKDAMVKGYRNVRNYRYISRDYLDVPNKQVGDIVPQQIQTTGIIVTLKSFADDLWGLLFYVTGIIDATYATSISTSKSEFQSTSSTTTPPTSNPVMQKSSSNTNATTTTNILELFNLTKSNNNKTDIVPPTNQSMKSSSSDQSKQTTTTTANKTEGNIASYFSDLMS